MSHYPLNADLIDLLKTEFPRLWNNHHNREDAMQTLWYVQFAVTYPRPIRAARRELAQLEKELGLVTEVPTSLRPSTPPVGMIVTGHSSLDTLDRATVHSMGLAA